MGWLFLTRRTFLTLCGTLAAMAITSCQKGGDGGGGGSSDTTEIFRLSGRGRRISKAAKKHNANKRFATREDAEANRAHPGDNSSVVRLTVSKAEYNRLFAKGPVADLRKI
jgi:hypothetical protein